MIRRTSWAPILAAALVVVVVRASLFTVSEGEQAVVRRFGRVIRVCTESGLKARLPFVDRAIRYPARILAWDGAEQLMPTLERKFVFVDITAPWRIRDPLLFYESVGDLESAVTRLDDLVNGSVRTVVSSYDLAEIVRDSNAIQGLIGAAGAGGAGGAAGVSTPPTVRLGRTALAGRVLELVRASSEHLGIEVVAVVIKQIRYSDELTPAVHARMISERSKEAAGYRSEGLGEKDQWLGRLQRDLDAVESAAYLQAETIKGQADARAAAIYGPAHATDPQFYELWKALQSYPGLLPATRKVLTTDPEYFRHLYELRP